MRVSSPASGLTIALGTWQPVRVEAADADGRVVRVELHANGTLVRSDLTTPYSMLWKPAVAGTYSLTAVAVDDKGAQTRSAAITVTVR